MTTKLTDMQLVLLATACQRADGSLLPPPASLGTQATRIRQAVNGLIKRALVGERDIAEQAKAWRSEGERHVGVVITEAGRAVIAVEERDEPTDAAPGDAAACHEAVHDSGTETAEAAVSAPRGGTKQALVLEMLRRPEGTRLIELVAATGWLPHTTRAALTGLRKKGHRIDKATRDGATAYMIVAA